MPSLRPDPSKPTQTLIVGKKGSGKTELAFQIFESYPYDRAAIDPTGDLKMPEGTEELELPLPAHWPTDRGDQIGRTLDRDRRPRYKTLRFIPDFHSNAYVEDMDRVVGMAYSHRRTCLFVDECQEVMRSNRTPPHTRRALHQGRHQDLTLVLATPRPKAIDTLALSQADWVYIFRLPNPDDRKRVAEEIGWHPKDFDDAVMALGNYEFLRYESHANGGEGDLAKFPALPERSLRHHKSGPRS